MFLTEAIGHSTLADMSPCAMGSNHYTQNFKDMSEMSVNIMPKTLYFFSF